MNDRELHCRSKENEERVRARRAGTASDRLDHERAARDWQKKGDAAAEPDDA